MVTSRVSDISSALRPSARHRASRPPSKTPAIASTASASKAPAGVNVARQSITELSPSRTAIVAS